jgi:hypothetical protein
MYARGSRYLLLDYKSGAVYFHRYQIQHLLGAETRRYGNTLGDASREPQTVASSRRLIDPRTLENKKKEGKYVNIDANKGTKGWIQLNDHSAARWETRSLPVVTPSEPSQWLYQALQKPSVPIFYRVGPWVLEQGGPQAEYYVNVVGSAGGQRVLGGGWFDMATGYESLAPDYPSLVKHIQDSMGDQVKEVRFLMRDLLRGGGATNEEVPASLATITGALFLAEVRRRPSTQAINLMCLDLMDGGTLTWNQLWSEAIHPVARGGGYKGDPVIAQEKEIDLTIQWLLDRSLKQYAQFDPSGQAEGDLADKDAEGRVGRLIRDRLASFDGATGVLGQEWVATHFQPDTSAKAP